MARKSRSDRRLLSRPVTGVFVLCAAVLAWASPELSAAQVCVDPATPGCHFSVTMGVSAAQPEDTISIAPGTYFETITISKKVTLTRAGGQGVARIGMRITYVRANASGANNGANWADAYREVQSALASAQAGDRIWVAAGTYRPDYDANSGTHNGDRNAAFRLIDGVEVFGGFAGNENPATFYPGNRDFTANQAILSGDIGVPGVDADNTYSVVNGANNAVLDGFTITGGRAQIGAGGIYNCYSSPTIRNCTFTGNSADSGGGMHNNWSSPVVTGCTFRNNSAASGGGGMYNLNGSPTVTSCTFDSNSAFVGGAISTYGATSPTVTNCTFTRNSAADNGGAMTNTCGASPSVVNCTFSGNSAANMGGAMANWWDASPTVINCTFSGNTAESNGDGLCSGNGAHPVLTNCILRGNTGPAGMQIWNNRNDSTTTVQHSWIDGGYPGPGNIGGDPQLTPDGHLRAGSQCIDAGNNAAVWAGATDTDGDPRRTDDPAVLDTGNGTAPVVDIGSDEFIDTDRDGLPDWWETRYFGSTTAADPGNDYDSDGLTNLQEYELLSSNPIASPLYVAPAPAGSDVYDGRAAVWDGTHGPKLTIQAALTLAADGDTVLVAPGTYLGAGNYELDYQQESVVVRASGGPSVTTIDCGQAGRAVKLDSVKGMFAVLDGFRIVNGKSTPGGGVRMDASRLMLRNCVLENNSSLSRGGGLYSKQASPTFDGLTIGVNTAPTGNAGVLDASSANLEGLLSLQAGTLESRSSTFYGPGAVNVDAGTTFKITGDYANDPATVFYSTITGPGELVVDAGQQLTLAGQAVLSMTDGQGNLGRITVSGKLIAKDEARIEYSDLIVRQAEISTNVPIQFNDVHMIDGMAAGGELFIQDNATIVDNIITSEGDRYLDMDPDPALPTHPTLHRNHTTVQIKTSPNVQRGTLLELRARDFDCGTPTNPDCRSGARHAPGSAGFTSDPSANWVLENLEVQAGSKLNLTNRPGLVYQTDHTHPETVYVKDLVLYPNAVLNTALQSLYYQNLKDEDGNTLDPNNLPGGRQIVDEPLLGFSLGIIAMDDTTASPFNEFDVRIRQRIRDAADVQDCRCDGICENNSPPKDATTCKEGSIQRVPDSQALGDGVMEMKTQTNGKQVASSVAAKGSFARAGDEDITVVFEYLFMDNPNAELIVKLSDMQDVGTRSFEVARVKMPASGRPGAIGSEQFATFYGAFPRVKPGVYTLNFTRGTYVEVELRGDKDAQGNTISPVASRVWIDNFDPQIHCSYQCADLSGEGAVTSKDFMLALAEAGHKVADRQSQEGARWIGCMDSRLAEDGYVDLSDILAFDSVIRIPAPPQACGPFSSPSPPPAPMKALARNAKAVQPAGSGEPRSLIVAGKSASQADGLYSVDKAGGASMGCPQNPVGGANSRGNGRVIQDGSGQLYQLSATQGLVRLDGTVIAGARYFGDVSIDGASGCQVHVGLNAPGGQYAGLPIADAAFNPSETTPTSVYVVPVLVTPPAGSNHCPYRAAARLDLSGGSYTIGAVYGKDPYTYSSSLPSSCDEVTALGFVWEPDRQPVREIEVDASGNVYILAAQASSGQNDWLLTYSSSGGNSSEVATPLSIPGPAGLLASATGNGLYLTSSVSTQAMAPAMPTTRIYRLNTAGVVQGYTDITHPAIGTPDPGYGFVATIAGLAEDTDGRVYAVGYSSPRYNNEKTFIGTESLFTTATLASFNPQDSTATAQVLGGPAPSLPLSVAFGTVSTGSATPGDLTCDGHVDSADLSVFTGCASGSSVPRAANCAGADFDKDGDVDMNDFGVLQRCWSGPDTAPSAGCAQ